jgi:GTP cyclohydrolase II
MQRVILDVTHRSPRRTRLIAVRTVQRVAEARLPTEFGDFRIIGYRSLTSTEEFVALVRGELRADCPTLVRIHSQCLTGDVFRSIKCDCGRQLRVAMEMIDEEGQGAIIYQQQEGRGIGIINKIRAYATNGTSGCRASLTGDSNHECSKTLSAYEERKNGSSPGGRVNTAGGE